MPMRWTPEAEARLIHHLLRTHNIRIDYTALAEAMGPECSVKAIVHRIAKFRKEGSINVTTNGETTETTVTKSSPTKAVAPRKATKSSSEETPANKKGKKRGADEMSGEDESSLVKTNKEKVVKAKKGSKAKKEEIKEKVIKVKKGIKAKRDEIKAKKAKIQQATVVKDGEHVDESQAKEAEDEATKAEDQTTDAAKK